MDNVYIGIDPGAKGCMCIIGKNIDFIDFNLNKYINALKIRDPERCIVGVELVHSHPKQGVKSMFTFGQRLGEIIGVLKTLGYKYYSITPMQWQKQCKVVPKSGKDGIYNAVTKLYDIEVGTLTGSRGGLKDGRCDALGIAHAVSKIKDI